MEIPNPSLGLLLHDAARMVRKAFERRSALFGLSSAQWRLLVHLGKAGVVSQARLAEALEIEPISVSRLIDRMEAGGWVERRPDPQDRRAKLVIPTEQMRRAQADIRAMADEVYAGALSGIPPEEGQILLRNLARVISNLTDAAKIPSNEGSEDDGAIRCGDDTR